MARPSNPKIRTQRHVTLDVDTYEWLRERSEAHKPIGLGYVIDDLVVAEKIRESKRKARAK